MAAPIIPLGELSTADKQAIRDFAIQKGKEKAVEIGIASMDNLVARDIVFFDTGAANDWGDMDAGGTDAVAGQEHWLHDASKFTAGDLSAINLGTTSVPDSKVWVFFGFVDLSAAPELTAIQFRRGSDDIAFWEVEQCYAYANETGGMIKGVIIYEQNDPISIRFNTTGGVTDLQIPLLGYVIERYGERITKPSA